MDEEAEPEKSLRQRMAENLFLFIGLTSAAVGAPDSGWGRWFGYVAALLLAGCIFE